MERHICSEMVVNVSVALLESSRKDREIPKTVKYQRPLVSYLLEIWDYPFLVMRFHELHIQLVLQCPTHLCKPFPL